jgi:hypothetical protein
LNSSAITDLQTTVSYHVGSMNNFTKNFTNILSLVTERLASLETVDSRWDVQDNLTSLLKEKIIALEPQVTTNTKNIGDINMRFKGIQTQIHSMSMNISSSFDTLGSRLHYYNNNWIGAN